MKGVFLGSDFMYRQDGKLVPVEINTNVALDIVNRIESYEEAFDLTALAAFVQEHSIAEIILEGQCANALVEAIGRWTGNEFENIDIQAVPLEKFEEAEDSDTKLYIRTSYSDEAIVDAYCRDKIEFLKLNQTEDFGIKYLYKNSNGELEGGVDLVDNGNHPNFIVKCRYPQYSRKYPKLLRFETEAEVRAWAEENLEPDFYISSFLYSKKNLLELPNKHKRLAVYRHIAALTVVGDQLVSIPIGVYTKWCNGVTLENPSLDMYEDGVLKDDYRRYYLSKNTESDSLGAGRDLLAEENDEILMADGTWKKVQDLKEGDKVRSLKVEGKDGADIHSHVADYNESLEEFEAETEFEEAEIISLQGPIEGYVEYVKFEFADGVTWNDTKDSSYLSIDPTDGSVRFQTLSELKEGDTILLLDATETYKPVYIQKVIDKISQEREFVSGYGLTLDGSHIFLSREPGLPEMFASIEHNAIFCKYIADVTGDGATTCRDYGGTTSYHCRKYDDNDNDFWCCCTSSSTCTSSGAALCGGKSPT